MKRRWLKLLVVFTGLGLAGFALYFWWCLTGVSGISRASVWRIKAGMSYNDVVTIIGVPSGDYRSDMKGTILAVPREAGEQIHLWHTDAGKICVCIDPEGKVTERGYISDSVSFFDKLYRWLGIDQLDEFVR
jgi:hypothetical protein